MGIQLLESLTAAPTQTSPPPSLSRAAGSLDVASSADVPNVLLPVTEHVSMLGRGYSCSARPLQSSQRTMPVFFVFCDLASRLRQIRQANRAAIKCRRWSGLCVLTSSCWLTIVCEEMLVSPFPDHLQSNRLPGLCQQTSGTAFKGGPVGAPQGSGPLTRSGNKCGRLL